MPDSTTSTAGPAAASVLPAGAAGAVEAALHARRSVRAFLPQPVEPALVERLLAAAARAPSGTNMQPWRVHVVTGAARDRLCDALVEAHLAGQGEADPDYAYYPPQFFEPYLSRRRKLGWDLYGLLGIGKGDKERMRQQHGRNFRFFDAPVGMIMTIDRRLEIGSWLDYGMFLQGLATAAVAHGLGTCPQAAFAEHHRTIRRLLPIGEGEVVVCGMALGYPDWNAPENRLVTERVPVADFTTFHTD
ncbi:nitroreductase [Pseudoroseomonas wenyumeiae]|uniref:Nitroreductase n=1 Tax=Teichococcus wenyumeiae TaxID=2478470 RepID=A0A3A9JGX9_9PROT|nr:nitroreductase [Pseudoroseomonas wenyumeiae]RKK05620.1 nitroreductase [Pseudoroseomonas wenyumeiae]RMI25072.1 nitroreductase [Pseudoroseomonas wenyumeiae]